MIRDTVVAPARRGPAGLPRRRALLRRLPRQPRLRARGAADGVRRGRRGRRAVRHQRRDAARLGRPTSSHDVRSPPGSGSGIHCHNDTGCAVANTLAAVDAGATHVQGTLNGYGERTGNADLLAVVANLELKLGRPVLPEGRLRDATRIAHAVAEVTNVPPASRQPYVGASAFAHKAGLHASAIKVDPNLYQHIEPGRVGNDMRLLVSDMAGRASIELKGAELGFDLASMDQGRSWSPGSPTRVKDAGVPRLHLRGRRRVLRAAARRGGRGRASVVLRGRVVAGDHRLQAGARRRSPRRPSSCSPGASGSSPPARATARSTPSTTRCARRSARPTRRSRSSSSSTTRCGSSTRGTAPTRSPGCSSRPPTASRAGSPSASGTTSSRRPGAR